MLSLIHRRAARFSWPLLACLPLYLGSCVGYTRRDVPKPEPVIVDASKVLVLHQGGRLLVLDSAKVDPGGIRGRLRGPFLPSGRLDLPSKGQRVDLWLEDGGDALVAGRFAALPWERIGRISVYDVSVGKTVLIWTAALAGAAAVGFLIFLLTKSSCPFVYADNGDGTGYGFQGEVFSGAIYPQLERDDWLPLPPPAGPRYRLRITNEVKEIQHMDRAALLLVRHPEGSEALLDVHGRPHTITHPEAPARCVTAGGKEATALVAERDSLAYFGGEGAADNGWSDGLDLTFAKPAVATGAKLVLRAKNSFWLDHLYGRFLDLFGGRLDDWNGRMRKAPREKLETWFREQGLPLAVEVEGPAGWTAIASLPLPGPMAARDFLIPFEAPAGDSLRVRLRAGFLFWEIDYAAVDFSPDLPVASLEAPPDTALDQRGGDLRGLLAAADGRRYDQPDVGDEARLSFTIPPAPDGQAQSAFLATRGYYDILRAPAGRPRTARLKKFREPGALPRFSAESLRERGGGGAHAE